MDQLADDTHRGEVDLDDFTIAQDYAKYILLMWKYRAWRNSRAHYRTSDQLRIFAVGFMLVHATAAIAVLGFSSFDSFFSDSELWKLFVALAGLIAVLVAIIRNCPGGRPYDLNLATDFSGRRTQFSIQESDESRRTGRAIEGRPDSAD